MTNTKVIVVVDDNPTIAHLLLDALEEVDAYDVRTVRDGLRALDLITSTLPDLVILDVHLPGISGFELFDRLRARPETADIPILFISAAMPGPELTRRGITEYLQKPFNLEDLLHRVEALCVRQQTVD